MKKSKYSALDIGQYVCNICREKNYMLTNMKLQKILYYIQAAFILKYGVSCFDERMEAWTYGPVVPGVYFEYNESARNNVKIIGAKEFSFANDEEKRVVDLIIEKFAPMDSLELIRLVFEETPCQVEMGNKRKIEFNDIYGYFINNKDRLFGEVE